MNNLVVDANMNSRQALGVAVFGQFVAQFGH